MRRQKVVHYLLLRLMAVGLLSLATSRVAFCLHLEGSCLVRCTRVGPVRGSLCVVAHHLELSVRVHRDLINVFVVSVVASCCSHGGSLSHRAGSTPLLR